MQESNKLTYAQTGINIDDTDALKKGMEQSLRTNEKRVLNTVGAFASLYDFHFPDYAHPVLVMKTEEPGSKQKLAFQHNRVKSICYDMIHHLINDIIVMGARPLAVQDAIICGAVDKQVISELVEGMSEACKGQDCVLTGGETSIQPSVIEEGSYILTSSIVGIVDKAKIIDGSKIKPGDTVLALSSNGIHTNGYTLVREVMHRNPEILDMQVEGGSFLDAIMEPHLCYYKPLRELFPLDGLHGLAHITGGGIPDNLRRILPEGTSAHIDLSLIQILPVFKLIKRVGNVDERDMLRTFNLGAGMIAVVDPAMVEPVQKHLLQHQVSSYQIGEIRAGRQEVVYQNELAWI